jgi:hypothetical protein
MPSRRSRPSKASVVVEHRSATEASPALELRTSTRRRKTATAWWEGQTLVVALPAHVRGREREELIGWLVQRSSRRRPSLAAGDPELLARAVALSAVYELGVAPSSVRFVSNQRRRWGSCTPETRVIRLSDRLRAVPGWVIDAVLVHELAHLAHPDHGQDFRALADRHPRQLEASRYLEGYQLGLEMAVEPTREAPDDGPKDGEPDGHVPPPEVAGPTLF